MGSIRCSVQRTKSEKQSRKKARKGLAQNNVHNVGEVWEGIGRPVAKDSCGGVFRVNCFKYSKHTPYDTLVLNLHLNAIYDMSITQVFASRS